MKFRLSRFLRLDLAGDVTRALTNPRPLLPLFRFVHSAVIDTRCLPYTLFMLLDTLTKLL
jgi:hypothetical protein